MTTKFIIILLSLFTGVMTGLLFAPKLQESGIKVIIGISLFLAVAVLYALIRHFILRQGKALRTPEHVKEGSEVGFVVDTFHDLVGKLKDKEKELARLKKLAEDKAVGMEVYSANILQSVPSGVVTVDNSMKIKSINQAAESILGVIEKEAINRDFTEIFNEPLKELMETNRTVSRGEYPFVTMDKRHIWIGATVSDLRDAAGVEIGTIFVFTDLTDIKALQAQVELKQRLAQLGEMSAGISHELRNSMSVISGYANLLSKNLDSSNKAAIDAVLQEIRDMDEIISELLAFAKPTVLNTALFDLNDLINKAASSATGNNEKISVMIKEGSDRPFKGDEVLLRQAFSNLFINAIESMPEGGTIEASTDFFNDKVVVTIKDTGQGIPDNIMTKIFLPFYTTKEKGIGFGLALVQKIIVSHGGSIDVESCEGEGTVFRVTLPVF